MVDTTVYPKEVIKEKEKLHTLVQIGTERLFRVKSIFPFTFFPDELIIDRTQVDIVYGLFFFSKSVFPMHVKDILNVVITTNFMFARLTFEIRGFEQNPRSISYLPKDKAVQAQQIVMGLKACYEQGIDLSKLQREEVLQTCLQIGGQPKINI